MEYPLISCIQKLVLYETKAVSCPLTICIALEIIKLSLHRNIGFGPSSFVPAYDTLMIGKIIKPWWLMID